MSVEATAAAAAEIGLVASGGGPEGGPESSNAACRDLGRISASTFPLLDHSWKSVQDGRCTAARGFDLERGCGADERGCDEDLAALLIIISGRSTSVRGFDLERGCEADRDDEAEAELGLSVRGGCWVPAAEAIAISAAATLEMLDTSRHDSSASGLELRRALSERCRCT